MTKIPILQQILPENWASQNLFEESEIPNCVKNEGSTTQKIRQYYQSMQIEVLKEGWQCMSADESQALNRDITQPAWIREVNINGLSESKSFSARLMQARTIVPHQTIQTEIGLKNLGNHSLGDYLWSHPGLTRGKFLFQRIKENDAEMWIRQSLFTLNQQPILLKEIFFPEMIMNVK